MRVLLRDAIKFPQPIGWAPKSGDRILVPDKRSHRAWTGIVERIGADMFGETVTVRVPRFKNVLQEWGLSQVRPHPRAG